MDQDKTCGIVDRAVREDRNCLEYSLMLIVRNVGLTSITVAGTRKDGQEGLSFQPGLFVVCRFVCEDSAAKNEVRALAE